MVGFEGSKVESISEAHAEPCKKSLMVRFLENLHHRRLLGF